MKINDKQRKENRRAGNDGTTVMKISGLNKDEMNNDGPYVCSQYSKLVIGPTYSLGQPVTGMTLNIKSKVWSTCRYNCTAVACYCCFIPCYFGF